LGEGRENQQGGRRADARILFFAVGVATEQALQIVAPGLLADGCQGTAAQRPQEQHQADLVPLGLAAGIDGGLQEFLIVGRQFRQGSAVGCQKDLKRKTTPWKEDGSDGVSILDAQSRAKSVTDVSDQGRKASELTGHRTEVIVASVYERRRVRKAPAVK